MDYSKNWTNEKRYTPYTDWNTTYIEQLLQTVQQSKWRTNFHLQPPTGLLNDPNGFSYFNNKWHLFYQFFPFGPVHGLKSWYHVTSKDLVHWTNNGIALLPNTPATSHGVYSGSALAINNQLNLFLTGNHRDQNNERQPFQLRYRLDKEAQIIDYKTIIEPNFAHYTEHFRDPQVIPHDDGYLLTIGAQNKQKQGVIANYFSNDLDNFNYLGSLNLPLQHYSYMVECPNLIFINQTPVLIFCPQGLDHNILDYHNIYPNTYYLGSNYDLESNTFKTKTPLALLDEGFDLYATQAFNAPDGRTLSISWLGLPDITYPSDSDGWSGVLSLVKELTIKNNHLYQYPVSEVKELRLPKQQLTGQNIKITTNNCYELEGIIPTGEIVEIQLLKNHSHWTSLTIDTKHHLAKLDRGNSGHLFAEKYGTIRTAKLPTGPIKFNIFIDISVIEIYFNDGYKTMSARIFSKDNSQNQCQITTNLKEITLNYYPLKATN